MALSKKQTLGKYSFFENDVIGKGADSFVYKGVDDQTAEIVAIKKIDLK